MPTSTMIVSDNLVLDEDLGLQDDEVSSGSFDLVDDALETYLLSLAAGATTGFPQYARKENFVTSSVTVNDFALVQDDSGTAFSTVAGEGVDSGLTDLDGNAIFLFGRAGSNNVVLGVIGDDPTGEVVFAVVLDEAAGGHTSADMWLIMYEPLLHPLADQVGPDDILDLFNNNDKIFIESSATVVSDTIFTTSNTQERHSYDLPGQEGAASEIVDSQLAPPDAGFQFWVQFTGDHATGGKNAVAMKSGAMSPVAASSGDANYSSGEIFFAAPTSIQATNLTNGVAGDTIQNGEVLDMLFHSENKANVIDQAPSQYADGIFLRFDGIGNKEDIVVILKLADKDSIGTIVTTMAIVVDNADIFRNTTSAGQYPSYLIDYMESKPLDNNDGLVVIESNDYRFGSIPNDYVIVGAQILSSTEKVGGSGTNLNSAVGSSGGSGTNGTQTFSKSTTVDTDVVKISDIGFIRESVDTSTVKDYLGIGANLVFEDNGPNIDPSGTVVPTLQVGDFLLHEAGKDSEEFSGLFTTPDYGADGEGDVNYDVGTPASGVDSELIDTETGNHVFLFLELNDDTDYDGDHKVVGREGTDADDAVTGEIVFVISADPLTGEVTLQQERAIYHDKDTSDTSVSFATEELVTLTATIRDSETNADTDSATVNIGLAFNIQDDVPEIDPQPDGSITPNDLFVDNVVGASDSSAYFLDPGNDLPSSFSFLGIPDTTGDFTFDKYDIDGDTLFEDNEIKGQYKGEDLYTLLLNPDGTYTFTMIGDLPSSTEALDTNDIKAGAPDTNSIEVGTLGASGNLIRISGASTVPGADGNINESNNFVGVDNGNLDLDESLIFELYNYDENTETYELIPIEGISIGTKSAQASTYDWVATLHDGGTVSGTEQVDKNGTILIDPDGDVLLDSITITKTSGPATKIGLGDIDILIPANDVLLDFDVRLTDGDGDFVDASFSVAIDGNHDNSIDDPVSASLSVFSPAIFDPTETQANYLV